MTDAMKLLVLLVAAVLILLAVVALGAEQEDIYSFREVYNALRMKESSNRKNPPLGDNGKARGPYQIWKVYWIARPSSAR